MAIYRVKPQFASNETLVATHNGGAIGLNSQVEKVIQASKNGPARTVVIRKASQSDLKALFESGNPVIELIQETPKESQKEPQKPVE